MTVTGVDFVTVPTQDLDRAIEFFGTTLGLERSVYRPERNFAEFETGTVTLSVVVAEKMGFDFAPTRNPLALPVADVAEARATPASTASATPRGASRPPTSRRSGPAARGRC